MGDVTNYDVITTYAKATTALAAFEKLADMLREYRQSIADQTASHQTRVAYLANIFANNLIRVIDDTTTSIDSLTATGDDDDDDD